MLGRKRNVKDILGPDKEDELLRSFVRIGFKNEEDEECESKTFFKENSQVKKIGNKEEINNQKQNKLYKRTTKIDSESLKKRKPKESFNEFYTDKDRAAAVSAGSYDIKQSLKLKIKRDRNEALFITEETDPNAFLALALKEIKSGNIENAIQNISRALELNKDDVNALVSRSKCYLLIGEPGKALQDAETALSIDKTNIRAVYQKAESLYYMGQFEQSLMFFYRGLKARPELSLFRLGVHKTQEAIENTIGSEKTISSLRNIKIQNEPKQHSPVKMKNKSKILKINKEKRDNRKLLGELCIDKIYLENLLKHPNLKKANTKTENISGYVKDAIDFLDKRLEFWRQQRQCTALSTQNNLPTDALPIWF